MVVLSSPKVVCDAEPAHLVGVLDLLRAGQAVIQQRGGQRAGFPDLLAVAARLVHVVLGDPDPQQVIGLARRRIQVADP
jgi:hypothetical protein